MNSPALVEARSRPVNSAKKRWHVHWTDQAKRRWLRLSRWVRWTLIVLVVLGVAFRLSLPFALKEYVNRQLNRIPDYSGKVESIHVRLWKGAYQIRDVAIFKSNKSIPVPLFKARVMDLSVQWSELFRGKVVGEILLEQPELNFVAGPSDAESQSGKGKPWQDTITSLFPFKINRFEIKDGKIGFQRIFNKQPVNIALSHVQLTATNLSNSREIAAKLPSRIVASGNAEGEGKVALDLKMNPIESKPTFEFTGSVTNVDLVSLNDFLRSYGKLDVNKGRFSMFTSVASDKGTYEGFIKLFFVDLDVFEWEKERHKNPIEIAWAGIAQVFASGLKNHPRDQLATQIPISGTYTNSHVGVLAATGSLLHNAFIRALHPGVDTPVTLHEVETKEQEKKE